MTKATLLSGFLLLLGTCSQVYARDHGTPSPSALFDADLCHLGPVGFEAYGFHGWQRSGAEEREARADRAFRHVLAQALIPVGGSDDGNAIPHLAVGGFIRNYGDGCHWNLHGGISEPARLMRSAADDRLVYATTWERRAPLAISSAATDCSGRALQDASSLLRIFIGKYKSQADCVGNALNSEAEVSEQESFPIKDFAHADFCNINRFTFKVYASGDSGNERSKSESQLRQMLVDANIPLAQAEELQATAQLYVLARASALGNMCAWDVEGGLQEPVQLLRQSASGKVVMGRTLQSSFANGISHRLQPGVEERSCWRYVREYAVYAVNGFIDRYKYAQENCPKDGLPAK